MGFWHYVLCFWLYKCLFCNSLYILRRCKLIFASWPGLKAFLLLKNRNLLSDFDIEMWTTFCFITWFICIVLLLKKKITSEIRHFLHLHNANNIWRNVTSVSSDIVQILMVILCVHLFFAVIKFWFEVLYLIFVNMCV